MRSNRVDSVRKLVSDMADAKLESVMLGPCECGLFPEVKTYMVETEHEWLEDRYYVQCKCGRRTRYGYESVQSATEDWNAGKRV